MNVLRIVLISLALAAATVFAAFHLAGPQALDGRLAPIGILLAAASLALFWRRGGGPLG